MASRLLCIQDEGADTLAVHALLGQGGWTVKTAGPHDYETLLRLDVPDCVVILVQQREVNVLQMLEAIHDIDEHLPVIIVLVQPGVLQDVVQFMKAGAHDVVVWPTETPHFLRMVEHAIHLYHLTKRVFLLENQVGGWRGRFDELIGQGAKMQEVFQMIHTVASSNATVLITGESGTGKELVARAIHRRSQRGKNPFMDLNCGAIPRELLENELFGHERGAFTGAERRYLGCCERADGGTLFLDEICEMEPTLQVKILRLLQERTYTRVGGTERLSADLRFIAATNRNIHEEVEKGRFREDLYYRLNVVPIHLPALRDRPEDIPILARWFLERFAQKLEKPFIEFAPDVLELLVSYQWPGNVRELENVIERMVVLNNDTRVRMKHLPPHIRKAQRRGDRLRHPAQVAVDAQSILPLDLVEKYAIESALEKCVGNVSEAAKRLKIGQATLYRKIRQYGLRN
ncbi:MAG: sigma-54-dependent Fis family transcriptional regulator [Deltaproteobacteria bacterium]|nr:sigma-54-dependent Fis family transcriptional regulator [Deltaproteobacteria bacterium]